MITIEDLIWARVSVSDIPRPDVDPLTEYDALQEAQMLDLRVYALSSTAALMFELRTALQLDRGNVAVLVVRGVQKSTWQAIQTEGDRTAWSVVGSAVDAAPGFLKASIVFSPSSSIEIDGTIAEFYVLEVPEIGEVPPDYCSDGQRRLRSMLPEWGSPALLLQASYLDAHS